MKFLQQLDPLLEVHTTAIEENLSESSIITALDRLRRFTARDIADFAFLHILALFVLNTSVDYTTAVQGYSTRTCRIGNFDKLSFVGTDLYVFLHILLGGNRDKLKKTNANDVFWRRCHLSLREVKSALAWLRIGDRKKSREIRFSFDLEKNLQIDTSNYRSIRRIINYWDEESTQNQKLAVTRLLFALRTRCPRSDILIHLESFAKNQNLEIKDAKNPEIRMRASEITNEAFNSTSEINWSANSSDTKRGEFTVNGNPFLIEIFKTIPEKNIWSLIYGNLDKKGLHHFKPTGESGTDAVKVLGAVVNEITKFLKNENPNALVFSGDKGQGLHRLYELMMKNLVKRIESLGYRTQKGIDGDPDKFVILKQEFESFNEIMGS